MNRREAMAALGAGLTVGMTAPAIAASANDEATDLDVIRAARELRDILNARHGGGYVAQLVTSHLEPTTGEVSIIVSRPVRPQS